jgi:hypothetical protein
VEESSTDEAGNYVCRETFTGECHGEGFMTRTRGSDTGIC